MHDLEKALGKAMTAKQLGEYLSISEKTVRDNYEQLGGVRIGRQIRFFERRVIYALEKTEKQIYSANTPKRSAEGEGVSHHEGSEDVGSKNAKNVGRRVDRQDRHCLLD